MPSLQEPNESKFSPLTGKVTKVHDLWPINFTDNKSPESSFGGQGYALSRTESSHFWVAIIFRLGRRLSGDAMTL